MPKQIIRRGDVLLYVTLSLEAQMTLVYLFLSGFISFSDLSIFFNDYNHYTNFIR